MQYDSGGGLVFQPSLTSLVTPTKFPICQAWLELRLVTICGNQPLWPAQPPVVGEVKMATWVRSSAL